MISSCSSLQRDADYAQNREVNYDDDITVDDENCGKEDEPSTSDPESTPDMKPTGMGDELTGNVCIMY